MITTITTTTITTTDPAGQARKKNQENADEQNCQNSTVRRSCHSGVVSATCTRSGSRRAAATADADAGDGRDAPPPRGHPAGDAASAAHGTLAGKSAGNANFLGRPGENGV